MFDGAWDGDEHWTLMKEMFTHVSLCSFPFEVALGSQGKDLIGDAVFRCLACPGRRGG